MPPVYVIFFIFIAIATAYAGKSAVKNENANSAYILLFFALTDALTAAVLMIGHWLGKLPWFISRFAGFTPAFFLPKILLQTPYL